MPHSSPMSWVVLFFYFSFVMISFLFFVFGTVPFINFSSPVVKLGSLSFEW